MFLGWPAGKSLNESKVFKFYDKFCGASEPFSSVRLNYLKVNILNGDRKSNFRWCKFSLQAEDMCVHLGCRPSFRGPVTRTKICGILRKKAQTLAGSWQNAAGISYTTL